jgi:FADH2 O2-dependent halogenase
MVERGRHPRFAIGESSTPLANLLIEGSPRADRASACSRSGAWQRCRQTSAAASAQVLVLLHRPGEPFADDGGHARQLLVAASPHDDIGDTHCARPDFDHNLVREAGSPADILDETELAGIDWGRWRATPALAPETVRIDASL